jgi:hypothetical protein
MEGSYFCLAMSRLKPVSWCLSDRVEMKGVIVFTSTPSNGWIEPRPCPSVSRSERHSKSQSSPLGTLSP